MNRSRTVKGAEILVIRTTLIYLKCTAETSFHGAAGAYRISIEYFDYHDGASAYSLEVNGKEIAHWTANNTLPTNSMNGSTSTRYVVPESVNLKPGDSIEIVGHPDGPEPAPVDYISIVPADQASAATGAPRQ